MNQQSGFSHMHRCVPSPEIKEPQGSLHLLKVIEEMVGSVCFFNRTTSFSMLF